MKRGDGSCPNAQATNATELQIDFSERGGCVIWIRFDPDTLELGPFLWFGGSPGEPMPDLGDKVGRHTRGNREGFKAGRENIRIDVKGRFTPLETIDDVVDKLFGTDISATD